MRRLVACVGGLVGALEIASGFSGRRIASTRVGSPRMSSLASRGGGDDHATESVRDGVREAYAATVSGGPAVLPGECGQIEVRREVLGYTEADEIPEGADLGLGCGNPLEAAKLRAGEVVLDLGSGAGVDCFIAAKAVGPTGRVIGVDMTHEMLSKARAVNKESFEAKSPEYRDVVSFRLGEIEHLPVGDNVVDCVISNCVINLSTDKPQVYREMARVLKPGGRLAISDVLRTAELPSELKTGHSYNC